MMINLQTFTLLDFERLKSWIKTEEELIQFAGTIFTFPLTDKQLNQYLELPSNKPFKVVLKESNQVIGHCELNFQNAIPRLSRILIGEKSFRGKGLGRAIVASMCKQVFENKQFNQIDLNVFERNVSAIFCYQKAGFIINPKESKVVSVNGENWNCLNMILHKSNITI